MAHDELPHDLLMARLAEMAETAVPIYGLNPDSALTMINHSENTTFRIDDPATGQRTALRVHRNDYHSKHGIGCELAWMKALREEAGVITPTPIPSPDGALINTLDLPGLRPRHCVLFEFLDGEEPSEDELLAPFGVLGEVSARMHRHTERWPIPDGFERLQWDFEHMVGDCPNRGDWKEAPALDAERLALIARQVAVMKRRLAAFGTAPHRFGLVHADLRLANLLIHDGITQVIDFDDSGMSWHLYDLATALSFIEERPDVPELIDAWIAGYRKVRDLGAAEVAEIPTFLMLRRTLILAWMGSHSQTDLALELGPDYTAVSCELAEHYLAKFG
jgi:Ser/Thr protein kinase RdoA (MazF antagonist)